MPDGMVRMVPDTVTIDFESPPLGVASSQAIHPYTAEGVTFTTSAAFRDAVLGLVKNRATSACAGSITIAPSVVHPGGNER